PLADVLQVDVVRHRARDRSARLVTAVVDRRDVRPELRLVRRPPCRDERPLGQPSPPHRRAGSALAGEALHPAAAGRSRGGRVKDPRTMSWWPMLRTMLAVYVVSRICVHAGAAVVAAELRVDANLAEERGLPFADPHGTANVGSATRPMLDVLTSWDGLWYMDIVRNGYPTSIPPDVTYHIDEARAAFF